MLGASNYPDSVMYYLSSLRFAKETTCKFEGRICPLCSSKMDRDHTIKCIYTNGIRTNRHDGIVNAIKKMLNKSRKATSKQLDNKSKPDIVMEVNNIKYCIDVNFSLERVLPNRYELKKTKYKGTQFTDLTVIPFII